MPDQTLEQRKASFEAAGIQDPGAISIDSINQPTEALIDPIQIEEAVPPSIATLTSDFSSLFAPTPTEIEAKTLEGELAKLTGRLSDEATVRAEQEKVQDFSGKQKLVTDLSSQLKSLQAEEAAIPLRIQEEAAGRGITTGGIQPIQTSRLRKNAIRALGTSAALEAAAGNLSLSANLVDRAVAAEFDPIKAEIKASRDNLALVFNRLNREDKQKAQVLNFALNERSRIIAKDEARRKDIYDTGITAQEFGAGSDIVQKIFQAKTAEEAAMLAGCFFTEISDQSDQVL